jgi:hypothetical protein
VLLGLLQNLKPCISIADIFTEEDFASMEIAFESRPTKQKPLTDLDIVAALQDEDDDISSSDVSKRTCHEFNFIIYYA